MIRLGERIKELRLRDGRTQETLASMLGVTAQAVSRWEKGVCYPDMEIIPSIANCFGVSIDELFGYDNERAKKVDSLADRINEMNRRNNGEDVCMDECIALAREALIEFPGNEKLTLALASALYNAGYVRRSEHHVVGPDGYSLYDVALHRTYPEWQEAVKLYEKLLPSLTSGELRQQAVTELSQLYTNLGEHDKALLLADSAPDIYTSKPFLRVKAYDGKDAVTAEGEALLETVRCSAELIESIVWTDLTLEPGTAAQMLQNAVTMIALVCTDGNYGELYGFAACLHMLRSYYLWLAGKSDDAFIALDKALEAASASDSLPVGENAYTAPLLHQVRFQTQEKPRAFVSELPDVWPWWSVPHHTSVKNEMQSDPRWLEWVRKTKQCQKSRRPSPAPRTDKPGI